jgi:deazaflavin-dependent oxidoreductase (nitroreductase family)
LGVTDIENTNSKKHFTSQKMQKGEKMNNTELKSPSGLMKFFFKIPVLVARMGFSGWERLFGIEWMLLITIGRKSGKKRYTMVDVLLDDRKSDTYFIEVGFGKKSDWFQNLKANPQFEAQVGRRKFNATAEELPKEMVGDVMVNFIHQRPAYAKSVMKMVGIGSTNDEDIRKMALIWTLLAIHPIKK